MAKKVTYEVLKQELGKLRKSGKINGRLTREERIDWAYGNTKVENDAVTREMVEKAVDQKGSVKSTKR